MKVAIVIFVGLCAILAQAHSYKRGNIYDQFRILEGFASSFNKTVEKVGNDLKEQLAVIPKETKTKLETIKANIVAEIEQTINKGGAFKQCAEKLVPEYINVEKECIKNFETCVIKDSDEYKKFSQKLAEDRVRITIQAKSFENDVRTCQFLPLQALLFCMSKQLPKYQGVYDGVVASSERALNDAQENAAKITAEAKFCNDVLLNKAVSQVSILSQQLIQCNEH